MRRRISFDRNEISRHPLDNAEYNFETEGLWIRIDVIREKR